MATQPRPLPLRLVDLAPMILSAGHQLAETALQLEAQPWNKEPN